MARKPEIVVLTRGERLRDSRRQSTSMSLPLAVHHRLELLAECAEDVGATRAEIVGMLISLASLDPEELEQTMLRYRKMKVGDVIPEDPEAPGAAEIPDESNVVSIVRRRPGRPAQQQR